MQKQSLNDTSPRVLVTGGSGFLGAHTIHSLLTSGYLVRTTLRSLARKPEVERVLQAAEAPGIDTVEFAAADLERDAGWNDAVAGCDFVLHVASPFPRGAPKSDDELILPAREGTLRVLAAAKKSGVRRVVMTSSFGTIGYGHEGRVAPFSEEDWSNERARLSAYVRSKLLAERAAWEFVDRQGGLQLSVINPVGIFGPALGRDLSGSLTIVQQMLLGRIPAVPRVSFGVVDVRDVAELHVKAMISEAAGGQRFLAVADQTLWMRELAEILRARLGAAASKTPTRELPDWLVRVLGVVKKELADVAPELGKKKEISNEKAKRILQWTPRPAEEAIVATAESLLRLGVVP